MYRKSRYWMIGALSLLVFSGCTTKVAPPPKDETGPAFSNEYRIGIGDSLKVDQKIIEFA